MKIKNMKIERRFFEFDNNTDSELITRADKEQDGKRYIMGYAQVNNSESKQITEMINGSLRTFTEVIAPGAIDENTDMSTVFHTVEHNFERPVGRVGANTVLSRNNKGLFFKTEIPADELATDEQRNLLKNVEQKIIKGASFAFRVGADSWERRSGELFRTITQISKIVDVTSTISGAYNDAFTFVRSLDESEIKEVKTEEEQPAPPIEPTEVDAAAIDIEFSLIKAGF